jgi:hypothetical protein
LKTDESMRWGASDHAGLQLKSFCAVGSSTNFDSVIVIVLDFNWKVSLLVLFCAVSSSTIFDLCQQI